METVRVEPPGARLHEWESRLAPSQGAFAPTPLRRSYQRARVMDTPEQLRECIDILENPQLIASEVAESLGAVEQAFDQGTLEPQILAARNEQQIQHAREPEWIYEGRDLSVLGDSCSFTCLSSNIEPIPADLTSTDDVAPKGPIEGLDFAGITCSAVAAPVVGTVQSDVDCSAYPLLLRGLAGLVELAPAVQLERMNHQFFKGALVPSPRFDLLLVTWYFDENADRPPISEFTRDISELIKCAVADHSGPTSVLNDIVCLRMNPARFDGRMRFDWRV